MSRSYKFTIGIFLVLIALVTYLEAIEPEPVNWNPSYSAVDKIPLGTLVLYDNLETQYEEVIKISVPPFEFLQDSTRKGTYMFINNHLNFDDAVLEDLLGWVEKGNTAFLATDAFSKNVLDTLGLNVVTEIPGEGLVSKPMVDLVHPDLKSEEAYLFNKDTYHSIFEERDSLNHTILGVSELYNSGLILNDPKPNFIKVSHGRGQLLLHTTPQAFTNFFLLEGQNYQYVERALAFLPKKGTLYWDEYKKAGKPFQTSPLYVLLGNKSLKWAYYFTLVGVLLFVLFEGKRKQRPVPIVKPLENQTYHFTRTIAGLYLDQKNYKKIAVKKIDLFLEYIRIHYRLPTASINEEFYQNLSDQTGKSPAEVKSLFQKINQIASKKALSKPDLLDLNSAIESLKRKNHGKSRIP